MDEEHLSKHKKIKDYLLGYKIGQGSFGKVKEAIDTKKKSKKDEKK